MRKEGAGGVGSSWEFPRGPFTAPASEGCWCKLGRAAVRGAEPHYVTGPFLFLPGDNGGRGGGVLRTQHYLKSDGD